MCVPVFIKLKDATINYLSILFNSLLIQFNGMLYVVDIYRRRQIFLWQRGTVAVNGEKLKHSPAFSFAFPPSPFQAFPILSYHITATRPFSSL